MQVFLVGKTFTQSSQLGVYELNVFHNGQHFTLIIIILMNLLLNALFPKGLMSQNLCVTIFKGLAGGIVVHFSEGICSLPLG